MRPRSEKLFSGKVLHVTFSSAGGAGFAAANIVNAQNLIGLDAGLLTISAHSISENPLVDPIMAMSAIVDNKVIATKNAELLTLSRAKLGHLRMLDLEGADVINLHWIAGALSQRQLEAVISLGKPIVWTLHDMRPLTGACHYTKGCSNFESGCHECTQVKPKFQKLVLRNFMREAEILRNGRLVFVAPSQQFSEQARRSPRSRGERVEFIPNPFSPAPTEIPEPTHIRDTASFLFVAADLSEPRKGLEEVIDFWTQNSISNSNELLLIGRNGAKYEDPSLNISWLGELDRPALEERYMRATGLFFASLEDNAPGVILEAVSFGVPIICLSENSVTWLEGEGVFAQSTADYLANPNANLNPASQAKQAEFLRAREPRNVALAYSRLYSEITA